MNPPAWLREVDHTGDVGIEVTAQTLEQLFVRAAWGMFSILTDLNGVRPASSVALSVEANDIEALLVRWLSELNFLHTTDRWLFSDFRIERLEDERLSATARGERFDPNRHVIYTEIKAVTFHDLKIERRDDAWTARVIFDM